MKQIRKRLTYANVMSSLAVFLVLGGATAFAAVQLGKNTVGTKQLKKNAVTAAKIKNGSVTNAKIQNNAVTSGKIADNAVGTTEIANDAVNGAKIAESSVGTGKLAGEAVTTGKIANDAVTGAKINEATLSGVVQNVTYVGKASSGDSTSPKILEVDCGPGRRVIGGFYDSFDFGPDVKITVHTMRRTTIGGEEGRGLQFFAEEAVASGDNWQLAGSAACATL